MKQAEQKECAYKAAGVDIEAGNRLVDRIKPLAGRTARSGVAGHIGGFGAVFDLKQTGYVDPVLISATDGVGTKLRVALETGIHDTVGIDLVAMCANDLVVQGAEPLFFLDYFATGRLDVDRAEKVVSGIAAGCVEAGCALIGGETAEMPGMYQGADYDLAGFCVGAAERDGLVTGASIKAGDVILGLASNGFHSNGFSLIRKIIADQALDYNKAPPFAHTDETLGQALMTPTRLYVKSLLSLIRAEIAVKGLAHITGGGLLENIPRILPSGCCAVLSASQWPLPEMFSWLARAGALSVSDMARTMNCGIGMALVCAPDEQDRIVSFLEKEGEKVYVLGLVKPVPENRSTPFVTIEDTDHWLAYP